MVDSDGKRPGAGSHMARQQPIFNDDASTTTGSAHDLPSSHGTQATMVAEETNEKGYSEPTDANGLNKEDVESQSAPSAQPPQNPMDPSAFPDGGLKAWTVTVGAFCAMFVSFGWINCIGVFQDYYQTHQLSEYSSSKVAWIPSLQTCMMFVGAPMYGKLFDNFGPRYILLGGTFLHVFGLMMTSISKEYYQFLLAQGICSPLGAGALFYPAVNSLVTWFFRRRALAMGIAASGSSLGGVIMPIMVAQLIPKVDFGWTMRICAFLILGLAIVVNLTVKSRIPPQPKPFNIMDFIRPFKELRFVFLTLACFLFFFGMFQPFTFIILHARRYGMSEHLAGYLVPILNASSVFGRTIPGYVADRVGRFNVMIFCSFLSAILVLALWLPSRGNAPIIVFAVLYGFSSGAFVSLAPTLVAQISDVRQIGVRTGSMFAIVSIGALTGTPIGGALIPDPLHGAYWKMQVFSGVVMCAGSTFFIFARIKAGGMDWRKKY